MMKPVHEYLLVLLALVFPPDLPADPFACRPYKLAEPAAAIAPGKYNQGLLWQISRDDQVNGYIFGTIHVDDPDILNLPVEVKDRFESSSHYVMELVPAVDDMQKFFNTMFFQDGRTLDGMMNADTYEKTVTILRDYGMTAETVLLLKPWAAFVLMSYPGGMGAVLDMKLLEQARQNNARISGLETIDEQIAVFSGMQIEDQTRILTDTVCHYSDTEEDFGVMKSLYMARDLQGLVVHSRRYQFEDNSVYDDIYDRLIVRRNHRMVDRMDTILAGGNAFIAVGAMHLPGREGILNLLEDRNYQLTRVY